MEPDATMVTATVLVAAGLFLMGWGYKLVRIAMAVVGLGLGAVLGWEVCRALHLDGWPVYAGMVGGAVLLAALMPLVRRAGMFVLGSAAGWSLAMMFTGPHTDWPMLAIQFAGGLAGGLAILFLERLVLVVASSYLGAVAFALGAGTLTGIGLHLEMFDTAPTHGVAQIGWPVIAGVLVLTGAGIAIQLRRKRRDD